MTPSRIGIVAVAVLVIALPVLLIALSREGELQVLATSSRPYDIAPFGKVPSHSPEPVEIRKRLTTSLTPLATSDLVLRSWRVEYGGRWEREITIPALIGPMEPESADVCGYAVRLGGKLFDTSGAGSGLRELAKRQLSAVFPLDVQRQGVRIRFPELRDVDFRISLGSGDALLSAVLTLVDGTTFSAIVPVTLVTSNGSPLIRRQGRVATNWQGPTREQAQRQVESTGATLGAAGGFLLGGPVGLVVGLLGGGAIGSDMGSRELPKAAEEEITRQVDHAFQQIAFGLQELRRPWAPLPGRSDFIRFRLADHPRIDPTGISLHLCASINVAMPRRDSMVSGFFAHQAQPSMPTVVGWDADAAIEIAANWSAINQVLYLLWQSGTLKKMGTSSKLLDALPVEIRSVAFDVTGFDPGLPPVVISQKKYTNTTDLHFVLGDVQMGSWGSRKVVGHATGAIRLRNEKERLSITAELGDLKANCVQQIGSTWRFTPCLSDLLPVVRDSVSDQSFQVQVDGGELLGRLPQLTFQNLRVHFTELRGFTQAMPPQNHVRVNARLLD